MSNIEIEKCLKLAAAKHETKTPCDIIIGD